MDDEEKRRLRQEILAEVGALLREQLAGDHWGRALVEVLRDEAGEPVVAGIDVEEIVGDESAVDAAFDGAAAQPVLPVLAKATEALCELEGVALEDVRGGTFLQQRAGGFAWLPGLLHVPSASLDAQWDELQSKLDAKRQAVRERVRACTCDREELDVERATIVFSSAGQPRIVARATLIGTYARASRVFAWGGYNRDVAEPVRRASAELADGLLDRTMWEISTPAFTADEATAWALAGLVCDRWGGDGVHCARHDEGQVFSSSCATCATRERDPVDGMPGAPSRRS